MYLVSSGLALRGMLARADASSAPAAAAAPGPAVTELRMESFERAPQGNPLAVCRRPVLLALLADGGVLAYRAFDAGAGAVRFRRLPLGGAHPGAGDAAGDAPGAPSARLVRFDSLGEGEGFVYRHVPRITTCLGCAALRVITYMQSLQPASCTKTCWALLLGRCTIITLTFVCSCLRSGVFVCGQQPLWLLAVRGTLIAHPMDVEGAVLGFTPFHNINCPRVTSRSALDPTTDTGSPRRHTPQSHVVYFGLLKQAVSATHIKL